MRTANLTVTCIIRAIRDTGLEVAPQKSEAPFFFCRGKHGTPPTTARVTVDGTSIQVGTHLKYLDFYLDATWSFNFARLVPRAETVAHSLSRLLPNLGGPDGKVRHLYATTVRAVVLYGSSVWTAALMANSAASRCCAESIGGLPSVTVSHTAVTLLAELPPIELYAQMYAEIYWRTQELSVGLGVVLIPWVRAAVRHQARQRMLERWDEDLSSPQDNS